MVSGAALPLCPVCPRATQEAVTSSASEPAIPRELHRLRDRYEFLDELGRGGMAVVYRARERESGRLVAVKVIARSHATDPESVGRFAREARTVMALQHPNIARTLGIEELGDGAVAIVTAYVSGETLRDMLRGAGPLSFERTAQVLRDVAAALAHAHAARIVHRDVKPENILIHAGSGRALLVDFGIARPLDGDTLYTEAGSSLGTPTYMSPEQVAGLEVDERTDVYALGLLGWEMLAGRRPWEGETLYTVLHKQQHEALPPLVELRPDVPAFLVGAINTALAKRPEDRPADAGELLARLTPTPATLPPAPIYLPDERESDAGATGRFTTPARGAILVDDELDAGVYDRPGAGVQNELDHVRQADRTEGRRPARRGRWAAVVAAAVGLGAIAVVAMWASNPGARESGPIAPPDSSLESLLDRASAVSDSAFGTVDPPADSTADSAADSTVAAPPIDSGTVPISAPITATPASAASAASVAARPPASPRPVAPSPEPAPRTAAVSRTSGPCASPTSADQRACLLAAVERDDAELTRVYQALIGDFRRAAGGAAEPPRVQSLRAEQRAWLVERDRRCRERLRGTEGPLWALDRAPCFAELSAERATQLRARRP